MTIELKYTCDQCGKACGTTIYGPLCFEITAPHHSYQCVEVQFCSLEHALTWLKDNIGRNVLI